LEYRPASEIEAWRAKDPLPRLRAALDGDETTCDKVAQIDAEVEQAIAASIEAAQAAPFPSLGWALDINWAHTFAPAAEGYFRELKPVFQGGQQETKLEPF
jgi:pyruvate dehydrogenase E1 component alpha subunit